MTEKKLATIYQIIRQLEWKRRNIFQQLQEYRERAKGITTFFGKIVVKGSGMGVAPQDRFIGKICNYSDALTLIETKEREFIDTYFCKYQTLVSYECANTIFKYISGTSYCVPKIGKAVRSMVSALNNPASPTIWTFKEHTPFTSNSINRRPLSACKIQQAAQIAARFALSWAADKPAESIINNIRKKCIRRNKTETYYPENEILYAQICALEREYIYKYQTNLTFLELDIVEKYMTATESETDIQEYKKEYVSAVNKLDDFIAQQRINEENKTEKKPRN